MSFAFDRAVHSIETRFRLGVRRVEFERFFEGVYSSYQVAFAVQSCAFAAPAFGPVGFESGRLVGIFERGGEVLQRGVRAGAVGVEDVV